MKKVLFLSLGSNIEPKETYLLNAVNELNKIFILDKISSVYKTDPVDNIEQDCFYNICIKYYTNIDDPYNILDILKKVEKKTGRSINKIYKGPREIDIDILFFDDLTLTSDILNIPHLSMFKRKFVLEPLIEILDENDYNDLNYIKKYNLNEMKNKIKYQNVEKIGVLDIG